MTDKNDPVLAYLENEQLLEMEAYAKRGRHLAAVDSNELRQRWITEFKNWANNSEKQIDNRAREDIQAELALRGEQPPLDQVKDDWERLKAAQDSYFANLDPLELAKKERELSKRIDDFQHDSKTRPQH